MVFFCPGWYYHRHWVLSSVTTKRHAAIRACTYLCRTHLLLLLVLLLLPLLLFLLLVSLLFLLLLLLLLLFLVLLLLLLLCYYARYRSLNALKPEDE